MNILQRRLLNQSKKKTSLLPDDYQQLTYIESTGTQYIDTGYKMKTTSKIDMSFLITSHDTSQKVGFFGSYEPYIGMYQLYASGSNNRFFFAGFGVDVNSYQQTEGFLLNKKYTISAQSGKIVINDNNYGLVKATLNANINLLIFARQITLPKASMRLYSFKIADNGEVVRHFIPCYRKADKVAGLYDVTNDKFYENAGTGEFVKGDNE